MMVPMWLFVLTLVLQFSMLVIAIVYIGFLRSPLNDRGHRCFAVPNMEAAKVVAAILKARGLEELFTFDAGPTHQTLFNDNSTVLIWHDESTDWPNGLSLAVPDPLGVACFSADILKGRGFTTNVREVPEVGYNKLVILESNAFDGWSLVFRRHIVKMGQPPNKRKITH